ncbi:MAG: hypothetical protein NVSMB10_15770 [Steroidobacteraceae bacterium]
MFVELLDTAEAGMFGHQLNRAHEYPAAAKDLQAILNPRSTRANLEAFMNIEFSTIEARVIGCLLEKEITTPDQYPLSLNALANACNQKTNREPVLELAESIVQQAVESLMKKYMVSDKSAGYGGRVTKYKHRFCNTEFGSLKFSPQEVGIICVLLLRGPQTAGELR